MTRNHLKARAAPRTWNILRKENVFVTRPNSGGQSLDMTLPLGLVLRTLNLGNTKKECNYILRSSAVLVNGQRRWDLRFPVGFMDVVSIPDHKVYRTLSLDSKGRLVLDETTEKHAHHKLAQVRSSHKVKGGKVQVRLSDGRTILLSKPLQAGATVSVDLTKGVIISEHPVAIRAPVILTSGKHRGKRGTIEALNESIVTIKTPEGELSTKRAYAFVLAGDA
jgi:small subunit ribosomal protein S4e